MENSTRDRRMYDSARWRKARKLHLSEHPLCAMCLLHGITTAANTVDHVVEHKGDYDMFWDSSNWQSLCASCHSGLKRVQEKRGYSAAADVDGMPIDARHPWNTGGK